MEEIGLSSCIVCPLLELRSLHVMLLLLSNKYCGTDAPESDPAWDQAARVYLLVSCVSTAARVLIIGDSYPLSPIITLMCEKFTAARVDPTSTAGRSLVLKSS